MKKISYRLFLYIVAAAFMTTACNGILSYNPAEEPEMETEEGSFQSTSTELAATAPDFIIAGQTKVGYNINGSTMHCYWSSEDNIGFWPDHSNVVFGTPEQVPFYVKEGGANSNKARFESSTWGLIRGKRYYAYHPYDRSASSNSVRINFNWQRQTANASTAHLNKYDYMHSVVEVPADTTVTVDFSHLCCIEAFTLTIPQEWRSCTFTSLELTASSAVMVTEATYNPSVAFPVLAASQTSSDIAISLGADSYSGISCDGNGHLTVYMSMCPKVGTISWKGETIGLTLVSSNGKQFSGSFVPSEDQVKGKVYQFGVNMQYDGPAIINLSQQETANCYVVSQAGDYKFKATFGNSSTSFIPGSVKILWETVNTTSAPAYNTLINADLRYEDGYIYFSTPDTFTEGNAVIAAYNAKNFQGDIVWSWHIWFTDAPADEVYPNEAGILMDRNLGALATSGNLACGMFYQWGRKDPITGVAATTSNARMLANGSDITSVSNSPTVGTVAYSIKHPNQFIPSASGTNGDWRWNNPKAGTDYQLSNNDVEMSLWYGGEEVKTKYDPCPPGYMIPYSGSSHAEPDFWGTAYGISFRVTGNAHGFTLGGVPAPFSQYSALWLPLADGTTSCYPVTGYVDDMGNRKNDGLHLMMWTNFPAGSDGNGGWNWQYSSCMDINMKDAYSISTHWNSTRAVGKSVRCMRMRKSLDVQSTTGNEGFGTPVNSNW